MDTQHSPRQVESSISSFLGAVEIDLLRSSQTGFATTVQRWSDSVADAVGNAASDVRMACTSLFQLLHTRTEMLEHITKSAGELYLGTPSSISSGNWFARDLRTYADFEKASDRISPISTMLHRRADVTEKIAKLQIEMQTAIEAIVQTPLNSVIIGRHIGDIQQSLEKSIKLYEQQVTKCKGKLGRYALARARSKLLVAFLEMLDSIYEMRERYEVDFVKQITAIRQLQSTFHERATKLLQRECSGLHDEEIYVNACHRRSKTRREQIEVFARQANQSIPDIDICEDVYKLDIKEMKKSIRNKKSNESLPPLLKDFLEEIFNINGNTVCADCSTKNPRIVVSNLGVLICYECAQIHEDVLSLSKPLRSMLLPLDDDSRLSDSPLDYLTLINLGNARVNSILESKDVQKPKQSSSRSEKTNFIISKYRERSMMSSPTSTSVVELVHQGSIPDLLHLVASKSLNPRSTDGTNALLTAIEIDNPFVADFLLLNDALVNSTTTADGNTPLHIACENSHDKCVQILLKHCADHTMRNATKKQAADVANSSCQQLLQNPKLNWADSLDDWTNYTPTRRESSARIFDGTEYIMEVDTWERLSDKSSFYYKESTGEVKLKQQPAEVENMTTKTLVAGPPLRAAPPPPVKVAPSSKALPPLQPSRKPAAPFSPKPLRHGYRKADDVSEIYSNVLEGQSDTDENAPANDLPVPVARHPKSTNDTNESGGVQHDSIKSYQANEQDAKDELVEYVNSEAHAAPTPKPKPRARPVAPVNVSVPVETSKQFQSSKQPPPIPPLAAKPKMVPKVAKKPVHIGN